MAPPEPVLFRFQVFFSSHFFFAAVECVHIAYTYDDGTSIVGVAREENSSGRFRHSRPYERGAKHAPLQPRLHGPRQRLKRKILLHNLAVLFSFFSFVFLSLGLFG